MVPTIAWRIQIRLRIRRYLHGSAPRHGGDEYDTTHRAIDGDIGHKKGYKLDAALHRLVEGVVNVGSSSESVPSPVGVCERDRYRCVHCPRTDRVSRYRRHAIVGDGAMLNLGKL